MSFQEPRNPEIPLRIVENEKWNSETASFSGAPHMEKKLTHLMSEGPTLTSFLFSSIFPEKMEVKVGEKMRGQWGLRKLRELMGFSERENWKFDLRKELKLKFLCVKLFSE